MKIVVDSNIFFSALLSAENKSKTVFFNPQYECHTCNFLFVEIFKHRPRIEQFSKLAEEEILTSLQSLLSHISFVNEQLIPSPVVQTAYELCKDIDEKDTPFLALSLFLEAKLLTGDRQLITGLRRKGFEGILELKDL